MSVTSASEADNWKNFSIYNKLEIPVQMPDIEVYRIRFPCNENTWMKLGFMDGARNAHANVELNIYNEYGDCGIFCNEGGNGGFYGGEITKFNIAEDWECEEDKKFSIIR